MEQKNKLDVKIIALTGMFIAVGLVLPFLTGQIPQIGRMLSPMHIPVFLCGFFCGKKYGFIAGCITPLLRSFLFGMPALFPSAVGMAFELATYGFVTGFLYERIKQKNILTVYLCLICAMLCGRIVWGLVSIVLYGIQGNVFTFSAFLAGAFVNAIPGIILHLILVPVIVLSVQGMVLKPSET